MKTGFFRSKSVTESSLVRDFGISIGTVLYFKVIFPNDPDQETAEIQLIEGDDAYQFQGMPPKDKRDSSFEFDATKLDGEHGINSVLGWAKKIFTNKGLDVSKAKMVVDKVKELCHGAGFLPSKPVRSDVRTGFPKESIEPTKKESPYMKTGLFRTKLDESKKSDTEAVNPTKIEESNTVPPTNNLKTRAADNLKKLNDIVNGLIKGADVAEEGQYVNFFALDELNSSIEDLIKFHKSGELEKSASKK